MPHDTIETHIGSLDIIDHRDVEWAHVSKTAYLIHQQLHYAYPGEIHDLHQRLMIIPPERYGGQRLVTYKLEVSAPTYEIEQACDTFGNHILNLFVAHVEREIAFTAWVIIERDAIADPVIVSAPERSVRSPQETPSPLRKTFLESTSLTMPNDTLRETALRFQSEGDNDLTIANRINLWVHGAMSYAHGVTGVRTPAADALAAGKGVCQDYAHIMLALCRLCGLPARYVSGHLLGEGGTHAWVEVLLPDPTDAGPLIAHPFDPTNGCIPGLTYITVAVGRDYGDVAPTSGTFRAPYAGHLSAHKRADITALEYFPGRD